MSMQGVATQNAEERGRDRNGAALFVGDVVETISTMRREGGRLGVRGIGRVVEGDWITGDGRSMPLVVFDRFDDATPERGRFTDPQCVWGENVVKCAPGATIAELEAALDAQASEEAVEASEEAGPADLHELERIADRSTEGLGYSSFEERQTAEVKAFGAGQEAALEQLKARGFPQADWALFEEALEDLQARGEDPDPEMHAGHSFASSVDVVINGGEAAIRARLAEYDAMLERVFAAGYVEGSVELENARYAVNQFRKWRDRSDVERKDYAPFWRAQDLRRFLSS